MILGIETGGTTVVCAAAAEDEPRTLVAESVIATTTPEATLAAVTAFVREQAAGGAVRAVGIGAFGPVGLHPDRDDYGIIGATPKPGWERTDLLGAVSRVAGCPVTLDSDVGAAVTAEHRWGAGVGLDDVAYATVGTGVGVGIISGGRRLLGSTHPEAGHLTVRRHRDDDYPGVCRFHRDCLEGLACGPAIAARWGRPADQLGGLTTRAVAIQAYYLGQLISALVYLLAPDRVILGGGVASMPGLRSAVAQETSRRLAGAVGSTPPARPDSAFLVAPALGGRAGVLGALSAAQQVAIRGGPDAPS